MFWQWLSNDSFSAIRFPKTFIIIGSSMSFQVDTKQQLSPIISTHRSISNSCNGRRSIKRNSSWPAGSTILTKLFKKWKFEVNKNEQASNMLYPVMLGNWQQSPLAITATPPNISSRPFNLRRIMSIVFHVSALIRLISSMNKTCRRSNKVFLSMSLFSFSNAWLAEDVESSLFTPNLNNLCKCSPFSLSARRDGRDVKKETNPLQRVYARIKPLTKVLPVPGRPEEKIRMLKSKNL